ncbi:hypothetical protein I4641_00975 [Waterburya agarophytonicola K14]|uniref:Uncharacterized protein n=1 Tax=Waterburya agarophytonicola KI4 TaxID=2874699 RepID=A0A964BMQ7_9CYAN|nr:hypothetical protein [Waterburya agarophytonicola]MCC0175552.1 hypothetical protein [Waterburya agarophytonicola KI4]
MKLQKAIAKTTSVSIFLTLFVILNHKDRDLVNHSLLLSWFSVNAQESQQVVAIKDLQPGKIQTVSGIVAALCDDEFILRDDSSPVVVKVDLEAKNIRLFQGEKVAVSGIYFQNELEAFEIRRTNGEVFKLNAASEDL